MSGDFLDQCDEEAVGMKNAWKQAECALGCEAVLKVLRTGGVRMPSLRRIRCRFKRKQAVVGVSASTAATTCSFSSGSNEQVE